jgi:hypothetical protein
MAKSLDDRKRLEHDPSSELGLKNPVRDEQGLGDEKYSVTPPREEVQAPAERRDLHVSCSTCRAELDPVHSYRIDADEYVYHFCGNDCYRHWRRQADAARNGTGSAPRGRG